MMRAPSFVRFRKEIAIAAVAALMGAALVLAALLALESLAARLSFACPRLPWASLAPPRPPPWRVRSCPPAPAARPVGGVITRSSRSVLS